jgi:hypothetical protein
MAKNAKGRAIDKSSPPSGSYASAVHDNEQMITNAIPPGFDHTRDSGSPTNKSRKQR